MIVKHYHLPLQLQLRFRRVQPFEEKEDVVPVGRVAEAVVELVRFRGNGPDHCHGLLPRSRQLDADITSPGHPDFVFLLPEMRAALINVDDLQASIVVIDDFGNEHLAVLN